MKFTLALLVTVIVSGSASVLRSREHQPKNHVEEEWSRFFPEISHPKIKERLFKDGGEYRYLYDSQILTGMPSVHYQFSGARIRAVVKIQLTGQKDLMQIEKVFVGSLHERFVSDPQTLVELSAFEPVKPEDAPFEEVLRRPVRFSYENGKINDFEVTEGDPTWSINIKRAIISTFHLSLTDREEPIDEVRREKLSKLNPESRNEVTRPSGKKSSKSSSERDNSEYFTVVEDGVAGRCEVSYLVMEIPDEDMSVYPIDELMQNAGQYESGSPQPGGRPRDNSKSPRGSRGPRSVPTDREELPVLNVTKTFDRRNCEFRPFVFKGLHLTTACPNCEEDPESYFDLLESSAHTRYNITGTKEQYIIDAAVSEAVYKITPRSHYAGSMVAYANVTTVLIESGSIKEPIRFPEGKTIQIDGLHMINAHFLKREGDKVFLDAPETDKPMPQKPEYWPNIAQKPQKVKALFEKLVHGMEPRDGKTMEIDTDISVLVEDIVRILDKAFTEELEQIHNAIKSVSAPGVQKEEIEHLFADLLVATGSNCTFTYLKRLLTDKQLEGPVVQDVLALMPFKMQTDKINQMMIEEYMDMCEDEDLKNDPFVERACWLSFGTLVHKACEHKWYGEKTWLEVMEEANQRPSGSEPGRRLPARRPRQTPSRSGEPKYNDEMPPRCPPETRDRVVQKVTEMLKNADSDEKKILAIKIMGNMGVNETIDELIEIAKDDALPTYVRTQAIYALKYTATDYPEMVYNYLLPLYRRTNQPTQVRIATLVTILASRPDLPILEDIAQSLNREIDLDVASYTYSAMTSLANSTHPCLKNLTRDLILALEHAKPVNSDIRHSKSVHSGKYIDHMKRGLFWEINHVMDSDAPIPRSGNFRLHATVMEKSFDLIEFGYETEGFGDAIRKYVGNYSREAVEEILSGRAARRPRATPGDSQVPDLEQIDQMLNVQPEPPKDIRGTAYLKLFGQQTRFLVINPQTISRTIVDVITRSQNLIPKLTGEGLPMDQRRATTLMDVRVDFPTIVGVPISTKIVAPVVASIKGKLKVHMEPKPAAGFSMLKNAPHKLLVESDVKTSIAGEIHTKMSVYLGFFKIGTGVRTRLSFNAPISGKFEFNMQDRMTKLVLDMPETPFKLVNISSYPVTYVLHYSKNPTTYQPKPVPSGHLAPHPRGEHESSEESVEMSSRPRPLPHGPHGEGFVKVNITDARTTLITGTGHVIMSKLVGLPLPTLDMWEIPTPMFVKSRKVHFQMGHESIAAKIDFKSKMEYPDTLIPTALLPVVGAKCELELKVTPNPGHKKLVLTIFERSEFTHSHSEKELLNKLKDKVADIPLKDTPTPEMDKRPKMGHSLQFLINSQGSENPQEWTTRGLLALIYSVDGRFVKLVAGMNSKVPTLPKKFCMTAEVKKPERNGMWFMTPQEPLNKSVQGNLEASWGDECGSEKYVKLRLRYQKTKEQMEVEKYDLYDENGIPVPLDIAHEVREGEGLFNSMYKKCEEDRQRGAFFSKECVDFAIWYSDLLRLKFDIEYKEVPRSVRNVLSKLERLVKFKYFWNTDTKEVDIHNPENRVNMLIEFSADRSYMDIKYQTPRSNVSIMNIDLPVDVQPISALVPWTPARLVGLAMYPACTISGPKIKTFDEVSDEMPLSQCWHVLAKDATDEKLFAVLVAAAGKNTIAKKVAVIFKDHKIEVLPTGPVSGSPQSPPSLKSFVVKYNGQELREAMTPEKYTTIPPNMPEDKEELAGITLIKPEESGNKEPILAIFSRPMGIKVLFDGSSVTVVPSPFWKNGLMGLCGSYDGQPWDDKLLPNMTLVDEPVQVSRAFLLNTRNCDSEVPEPHTGNKLPKSRLP